MAEQSCGKAIMRQSNYAAEQASGRAIMRLIIHAAKQLHKAEAQMGLFITLVCGMNLIYIKTPDQFYFLLPVFPASLRDYITNEDIKLVLLYAEA